jgi:hypothetical protein
MLRYMYGQSFPPIRLANVNGALILMDGWHRLAAQRKLKESDGSPKTRVLATIETLTENEARWQAALANTTNGLPLHFTERVNVFHAFIKTGQHRRGKRGYKSYREIARELGGLAPKSTVHRWMKEHYPKIARRMAENDYAPRDNQSLERRKTRLENLTADLERAVKVAVAEARGLCPTARVMLSEALAKSAQEGAKALRNVEPWTQEAEEITDF